MCVAQVMEICDKMAGLIATKDEEFVELEKAVASKNERLVALEKKLAENDVEQDDINLYTWDDVSFVRCCVSFVSLLTPYCVWVTGDGNL